MARDLEQHLTIAQTLCLSDNYQRHLEYLEKLVVFI